MLRLKLDTLSLTDVKESLLLSIETNRGKPKLDAARSKWVNYFADVVADDAESCGLGVSFDDATKRSLGIDRHRVSFIENDDLDLWNVTAVGMSGNLPLSKLLYFFADNSDTSVITCIQLHDSLSVKISTKEFFSQS